MYPTIIKKNLFKNPLSIVNYSKTLKWNKSTDKDNWPGSRTDNLLNINLDLHFSIIQNVVEMYFGDYDKKYKSLEIDKSIICFHKIKYEDWINSIKPNNKIHQDNCDLAGIIYLNLDVNDENTGTSLYDENKKPTLKISNNFNTIACYDGKAYHGATSLDKEERLTMVIFLSGIKLPSTK